jgi:hypothetical protein
MKVAGENIREIGSDDDEQEDIATHADEQETEIHFHNEDAEAVEEC